MDFTYNIGFLGGAMLICGALEVGAVVAVATRWGAGGALDMRSTA